MSDAKRNSSPSSLVRTSPARIARAPLQERDPNQQKRPRSPSVAHNNKIEQNVKRHQLDSYHDERSSARPSSRIKARIDEQHEFGPSPSCSADTIKRLSQEAHLYQERRDKGTRQSQQDVPNTDNLEPWQRDAVPTLVEHIAIVREFVENSTARLAKGVRRTFKRFSDEQLANRLAAHLTNKAASELFSEGFVKLPIGDLKPDLQILWDENIAAELPSLVDMNSSQHQGQHPRGVYLLRVFALDPQSRLQGEKEMRKIWYYVGSGNSRQGMIIRPMRSASAEFRGERPMLLHSTLSGPDVHFVAYSLSEWDPIPRGRNPESTYRAYPEILICEALWQCRLRTISHEKGKALLKKLTTALYPDEEQPEYDGLNVISALELGPNR